MQRLIWPIFESLFVKEKKYYIIQRTNTRALSRGGEDLKAANGFRDTATSNVVSEILLVMDCGLLTSGQQLETRSDH